MKLLHVTPSFFPATYWGGPIFSTKSLCDWAAGQTDIEVRVLSTDAAGPERSKRIPLSHRTTTMDAGYAVTYFRRILGHSISPGLLLELPLAIRRSDVVHLSATYSFPTLPTLFFARLFQRPIVWSPRGAIQASHEWDGAPNQSIKRAFEQLARLIAPKHTVLLVTAESEAAATAARMPRMRIEIVPNSVAMPAVLETEARSWRPNGRLRLLFLSRIHEKKGIDLLINAVSQLENYVTLDVYGSGEASYVDELKAQVMELGLEERIRFCGHVDGPGKTLVFRNADLFVLPSHSENFGIAIAEALAHGVPVITTDTTPWTMLEAEGCGRTIPLEVMTLTNSIKELSNADLENMGRRGRDWMERDYSLETVNRALRSVYDSIHALTRYSNKAEKGLDAPSSHEDPTL